MTGQTPPVADGARPSEITRVDWVGLVAGQILTDEMLAQLPGPPAARIRRALLAWFRQHGRQFPWREPGRVTPWSIVLTEILLRKTGAAVVAQRLPAFLTAYPSPERLLAAGEDTLVADLAPFGLRYQRAVQLRLLAAALMARHGGAVPVTLEALLALPGIGRYAATATLVYGFGLPGAAVDTNIVRLLGRLFGIRSVMLEARKDRRFWELAARLASRRQSKAFNWAMLDLAALVCTPQSPACAACPLRRWCWTGQVVLKSRQETATVQPAGA